MPPDDDAATDPNIGRVIADRYRIVSVIAKGGMGKVYRGEHVHMRNQVAIKLLKADTEDLPQLVARFERESIVGAHARHENVGMATDFGRDQDGSYYLVMEYIDGVTLRSVIDRGPLPEARALDIALQIAHGLDAIHELDIVHRDLNPRNVMLAEDDLVKLIDFGFARVPLQNFEGSDDTMSITTMGEVFGTVGFIAPEAVHGMVAVDEPADLYALGVILYEMLTGQHPFDAKGHKQLFRAHTQDEPPPPSSRVPRAAIHPAIEKIIMRLLEKDPRDRYRSAIEVADALEAVMDELERPKRRRSEQPTPQPAAKAEVTQPIPDAGVEEVHPDPPVVPLEKSWSLRIAGALFVAGVVVVMATGSLRARVLGMFGATKAPPVASSGAPESTASATASSADSAPAPTTTARARPTKIDGVDADGWETVLEGAVTANDIGRGAKALTALAAIDPTRFEDLALRRAAAGAATMIALGDQKKADAVFGLLASDALGSAGPDILFRMVTHHGGSQGAKRAAKLLAEPEIMARATPALKIARELRNTPCGSREALLDRAVSEGDHRALAILTAMDAPTCIHTCCMRYNHNLDEAIRKLRKRLR
jgi:serine/threonine-protein kinase